MPILWILGIPSAVLLNCLFTWICQLLSLPLFGDSAFTIAAGLFMGPLAGMIAGALTNVLMDILNGFSGALLPFAAVNTLTGLFMGLAGRYRWFSKPLNVLWIILGLVIINAGAGALIAIFLGAAKTTDPVKIVLTLFSAAGYGTLATGFLARLPMNLIDKGLPVIIFYPVYKYLFFDRIWKAENFPDS